MCSLADQFCFIGASLAAAICPTGAMKNKREKADSSFESSGNDLQYQESLLEVQCTYMYVYICNCNNGSKVWVCGVCSVFVAQSVWIGRWIGVETAYKSTIVYFNY